MVVKNLSDKDTRRKKFQRFFVMGVVLLVVALIISIIPTVFIGSINGRIDFLELKDNLNEAEQEMLTDLEWSKIWWETTQTTMFGPISTILFVIGFVLIAYGLVVRFA